MKTSQYRLSKAHFSFVALTTLAACSIIIDSNVVQCRTDRDCVDRGFPTSVCSANLCGAPPSVVTDGGSTADAPALDPKWSCLGSVKTEPENSAEPTLSRYRLSGFSSRTGLSGVVVKACNTRDISCSAPLTTTTTDESGYANQNVPKFFAGYYEVAPLTPDGGGGGLSLLGTLIYPGTLTKASLPDEVATDDQSFPVLTAPELDLVGSVLETKPEPQLGHVLFGAVDCEGNPASGVSATLSVRDRKTVSFYNDDTGTPTSTLRETKARGEAGFFNVPTNLVTIEARVESIGKRLGTFTVLVRPAQVTIIAIQATP